MSIGQVTSQSVALGLAMKVQLLRWSSGRWSGLGLGEIDLRIGAAAGPREEVRGVPRGDLGRALAATSILLSPGRWLIRVTAERRPGSGSSNRVRSPRPSGAIADRAHVAGSASRPGRTVEGSDRLVRASPVVRPSAGRQRCRPLEMVRGSPRPRPRTRPRQPRPYRWRAAGRGLTSRFCGRRPCRRRVPKRELPRAQPRVDRCAGPHWLDWRWLLARLLPVRQWANRAYPPCSWWPPGW
jgi:hypothetical protein